ncbi:MAG: efflux RND transporter permease subunit [Pseudomonadota bacterium]
MRLSTLALRRPVTIIMFFVSLVILGGVSSRLLQLEFFPEIEFPGMLIIVPYEGSTPEEVERLITRPTEDVLATLGDIQRMRSSSNAEGAFIFMFFGWDSDLTAKGVEARDKIDGIRHLLPDDLDRVFVRKFTSTDEPMLVLRIGSDRDLSRAYQLLERNVLRRIERLPGVASVNLDGVMPTEVRIELLADRISAHQIDLNDLRIRLAAANFSSSAGFIDDASTNQRVRVNPLGEFRTVEDIRQLPINTQGLRLGDIAEVSYLSPPHEYGRLLDGNFALGLDIFKESDANLVDVTERVLEEIEAINQLPEMRGIDLFIMFSQAEGVVSSLKDLALAGLIGALMSMVVLFVFLRQWASTVIVMLSVPAALMITLGGMYFLGLSLNILTMMGLMLAVGMLVDNSVVVTESIYRQKLKYPNQPGRATLLGVQEVGTAVTAGTLTTIIVFAPNIFGAQNQITIFLAQVAYTITISLLASLLIARTIIPLLLTRVSMPPEPKQGSWLKRMTNGYAGLLAFLLRRRWMTTFAVLAMLVSTAIPLSQLSTNMFDETEEDRIMLHYNVVGNYSLDTVRNAVDRIEAYLLDNQQAFEFESVYTYYNNNRAESTLILNAERTRSNEQIREAVRANLPMIAIGQPSFEFSRGGGDENIGINLHGESSERLFELSTEVVRLLSTVDGLTDVRADATNSGDEVQVRIDRERAARNGLSTREVAQVISVAMRGETLNEFRGPDGDVEINLMFQGADRGSAEDLANLTLVNAVGDRVRLSAVASIGTAEGPAEIQRDQRRTTLAVNANLNDITMNEARERMQAMMDQLTLPPGYGWSFGRAFFEEDEAMQTMLFNMLLALALIFIVMAALFESTLFPISILTSIVFSFVGVFWFFFLTGTDMNLMGMIGLLVLMGIVVNNGIVLIDHVNQLRGKGLSRESAIIQAGRDRLRPILMTAATTILAMIPLAIGDTRVGGGGPAYFPMARAVIGGLAFSTLVSLVVVPFVYLQLDRLREWSRFVLQRARTPRVARVVKPTQ